MTLISRLLPRITPLLAALALAASCTQKDDIPAKAEKAIRISTNSEPLTLDPRQVRRLSDTTFMHLMYEGLMRRTDGDKIIFGMAESYDLSEDMRKITFRIKKSEWSDGQPVTAQDFEESWKSMLAPDFPAPNAYQLYCIKGAELAKAGEIPLDKVGITALDDTTLLIELERPTPYFLELAATYFTFPVCRQLRQSAETSLKKITYNGPFKLHGDPFASTDIAFIPNSYYWDRPSIALDRLTFSKIEDTTALNLYENNELEWTGSPLSTIPLDAIASLKASNRLKTASASSTYFFRLNTKNPWLSKKEARRALSLALNRKELVEEVLQGNELAAQRYLPPFLLESPPLYKDTDFDGANELAQNGAPTLKICYGNNPKNHKIAQVVQQQWKRVLALPVELEACESKLFFDKLQSGNYEIALGSWFSDIPDPISFLDVFASKDNGTNNTFWEDPRFAALIAQSGQTAKVKERHQLLLEAEKILIEEMPIIPLFHSTYNYLCNPNLKGVYLSSLGYLDFKSASFE